MFGGPGIPSPGLSANQISFPANTATRLQRKKESDRHEFSKREGEKTEETEMRRVKKQQQIQLSFKQQSQQMVLYSIHSIMC